MAMTKRLLIGSSLLSLLATLQLWAQPSQNQQSQNTAPPAKQQPTPAPSTNETKASTSTAITAQSITLGNPVSSVPLGVKGKFRYFAIESFRPGIYPVAAFYDGLTMANPPKAYPPEWRQGLPGFARNYGDFMASWASVQGGKFIAASLLHEDPRYFPSNSSNFFARIFNAARYAVIDRGDNGHPRIAIANVAGAFSGGFVGNGYLPDPYANFSHGLGRSALALTGFVTSNLSDEFRPEIRRVVKKLHLPLIGK
jgi:hypothetical protein